MELELPVAERFANLALSCLHREYPTKLGQHMLNSDADVLPPRELTPAFYGCYDWHSSVHGHWMLARLARRFPGTPLCDRIKRALAKNFTRENLRREADYAAAPWRSSFERPYGLAWLLQLAAELAGWEDSEACDWSAAIAPLESVVRGRLEEWLPKLRHPVRSGEHSQSAFSLGLMLDYAHTAKHSSFETVLAAKIREFYWNDRGWPMRYEPSGEDFLSPGLAEADVVRRIMPRSEFAAWLTAFLPEIPSDGSHWLEPARSPDPGDPKLSHLDGLNLSRAWMLSGIAAALPSGDARLASLAAAADQHARAGLASVTGRHYEGAHWLATFAVYLLTKAREPDIRV